MGYFACLHLTTTHGAIPITRWADFGQLWAFGLSVCLSVCLSVIFFTCGLQNIEYNSMEESVRNIVDFHFVVSKGTIRMS